MCGANQFKVTLDKLRDLFNNDAWMHTNCLVAVSGGSNDGTPGMKSNDSFAAARQEIDAFAKIVFSPNSKSREFWLGQNPSRDSATFDRDFGVDGLTVRLTSVMVGKSGRFASTIGARYSLSRAAVGRGRTRGYRRVGACRSRAAPVRFGF